MESARKGHVECMRAAVETGSDVNKKSISGDTPLILAASEGHVECMTVALKAEADVNIQDRGG